MHLSIRTTLRAQDTSNNLCILAFGPRFEPKTLATTVHLSIRTPLRAQDSGNNLCNLAFGPGFEPKTLQQNVHLCIRTPLRAQDTGNKSYILAFRTPLLHHSDPASSPRHRQLIAHLSIRTPLRAQDTGNKSYILAFRPCFEPKIPAATCTSKHSEAASSPRHRQQLLHLSIRTPLRAQDTGNKSYILASGPRCEPKTLPTNRKS